MRKGRTLLGRVVAEAARERWELFRREAERPWREGRRGAAAEAGRWIGVGLAVGAVACGIAAALYAERRRR